MQKPDIWHLVLTCLLPNQPEITWDVWRDYIERHILPEVHLETRRFYGETSSTESSHPGLDYANKGHRRRLEAFHWHKQLFGVFDHLRLTTGEIQELCDWEGTLLAKELFECEIKRQIPDTTWDEVAQYHKETPTAYVMLTKRLSQRGGSVTPTTAYELGFEPGATMEEEEDAAFGKGDEDMKQDNVEEAQRNHSVNLNQQFMDTDWEQWMKEALERGDIPYLPESSHFRNLRNFTRLSNDTQAQALRVAASTAPSHRLSLVLSRRDGEQPHMEATPDTLNDDISHSSPMQPTHSSDQPHQVFQPLGIFPFDPQRPTRSLPSSSIRHAPIHESSRATSQLLDQINSPQASFWGREAPEIFSDYSRSHIAASRNSISQPARYTQFYPSARVVSASTRGLGPAAPTATPSPSLPL